ncbi:MAG: thioredoxin domain-containing protein [Planctomycetes bacterium]|nr:thioredoxin domain-containing protein [Planctomycetota bacterium]
MTELRRSHKIDAAPEGAGHAQRVGGLRRAGRVADPLAGPLAALFAACYLGAMPICRFAFVAALVAAGPGCAQVSPPHATPKRPMNHLARETSPYLLSHRHNPVDWYPWGAEALAKAKRENKPIFLSIGYSACHWCHVMERESFENAAIAKRMNELFVNIKVDREERPDLDEIYMAAVLQLNDGHGGWPMSVWLTPDLKPFAGGTYFPPEDAHGRRGFKGYIELIGKAWQERRAELQGHGDKLAAFLVRSLGRPAQKGKLDASFQKAARAESQGRWDAQLGGFGSATSGFRPKFPHASELSMLLRHHARHRDSDKDSLAHVERTLEHMRRGGIHDQLGGGFHRYSVDREWLVPHFEKMLYDNALLVQIYLEAHLLTGKSVYRQVAATTLDYLLREMQDPAGGFYSATDADSEGVEGKFFVWSKRETDALLGDDAAPFAAVYGITEQGNWHEMPGQTVLSIQKSEAEVAVATGVDAEALGRRLAAARQKLLAVRAKRVAPHTDDKVLAAWNGMAIAALARGYQVTGEVRYLDGARRAAGFVLEQMRDPKGRLLRTWRRGTAKLQAYLEDHAFVADGLLHLFECDFDPRWLAAAKDLLDAMHAHFRDPKAGDFWFTADDHEQLLARSKSVQEGSIPSGAAVAIQAFARGGMLLADPKLTDVARTALEANHGYLSRYPSYVMSMLEPVDLLLHDPKEVVLIANDLAAAETRAFLEVLRRRFPVGHVITVVHPGNRERLLALVPAHRGKEMRQGRCTAYVCRFGTCLEPVTRPQDVRLD